MLEEYNKDTIAFYVNKKLVSCPRLVEVNGEIQLPSYQIQDGDVIEDQKLLYRRAARGVHGFDIG